MSMQDNHPRQLVIRNCIKAGQCLLGGCVAEITGQFILAWKINTHQIIFYLLEEAKVIGNQSFRGVNGIRVVCMFVFAGESCLIANDVFFNQ